MRLSYALVLLALAACDRTADKPAQKPPKTTVAPEKPAPPPAQVSEDLGEVGIEALTGVWRVTGVVPDAGAKYAANDKRIVGSLVDIFPDEMRWSYKTTADFPAADVCLGPVSAVIAEREFAAKARALLAPAIGNARKVHKPHQWLCGDGGNWGDDAEFQPFDDGKMAMRWRGGVTLLLERVKRPDSNPPATAPTGAFPGE